MRNTRFIDLVHEDEARRMAGPVETIVNNLTYRSGDVAGGSVFAAIPGSKTDGHKFIPQAIERGASALILSNPDIQVPKNVAAAWVESPRKALAVAASRFYGHPSHRIPVIAITGTNGKTTTTYLLEAIWKAEGRKPAIIGTINYRLGEKVRPASVTTPESLDIQRLLDEMIGEGADAAAIEVSSHALEQGRVWGLRFAARGFSNLSRDHLDYHGTMEAYFAAKATLFTERAFDDSGDAAINADDSFGMQLIEMVGAKARPYGIDAKLANSVKPLEWRMDSNGLQAKVSSPNGTYGIKSRLVGRANLYNILCAITLAEIVGISHKSIERGIEELVRVPGRLERVENDRGILVSVDYSHTPDALEKALLTLRELTTGRLIVVFGCGGDRDRGKRPIMGKVAASLADVTVVTSDNPRSEKPDAIIGEILVGINSTRRVEPDAIGGAKNICAVESDRRAAIFHAIAAAKEGDTVLIAGKGHEDYQILGERRIHFDDREVAAEALKNKR